MSFILTSGHFLTAGIVFEKYPFGVKVSSIRAMANRKITHCED